MANYRVFAEKKELFRVEAEALRAELNENLQLNLGSLRLVNVYDLFGFSAALVDKTAYGVFGEKVTDLVTVSTRAEVPAAAHVAIECLPGQFDQRASSAEACVKLVEPGADIRIKSAQLLLFGPGVGEAELAKIRRYLINPVDSREKDLSVLAETAQPPVRGVKVLEGFRAMGDDSLAPFCGRMGLAMSPADLREVVSYFTAEGRDPSETELRILDTYWSDHCRHTTFSTVLTGITVEDSFIKDDIEGTLRLYLRMRRELRREDKPLCLMDIATAGARYLRTRGLLDDMEESEENNACSIYVDVDNDGRTERWLLMFKNETHNHPTEIEPFGGAATCLGGAIRDPLSGRSYVYQAMRITGAGDIWKRVSDTMPGKLPQKVISRKAAQGYSSYGNQIGLATTHVHETVHPGYTAKRMEIGAVAGAVKADQVRRESPVPGDVILLLGGRTGRDGIGGATGSSKEHTQQSLETCGSEVQKGNAPEERKLQRLFRRADACRLIKKSNDFGAGGVSVAIGELAPGLDIWLDRIPTKYSGLDYTELAISESQERMAVVISAKDEQAFREICRQENMEVTHVAEVTDTGRMRLFGGGVAVADLKRSFIDSAGARHYASATVQAVQDKDPFAASVPAGQNLRDSLKALMRRADICSQEGLVEMFDSTIGRSTVLMPYGGRYQASETQVSVQKLPTGGYTDTASMMSWGFDPFLSEWSPYHGAAYAVVSACAKTVAAGGDWSRMRFSFQEYFERMGEDPHTWGKPLAALLGALKMQDALGLPSIGGKDSMSGSFGETLHVPPTLVAFGICTVNAGKVISTEFKKPGNSIYLFRHRPRRNRMPDTSALQAMWNGIHARIGDGTIVSAFACGAGGAAEALCKMAFGNGLGVKADVPEDALFRLAPGSVLVESTAELPEAELLGTVTGDGTITLGGTSVPTMELLEDCRGEWAKVYRVLPLSALDDAAPAPQTKAEGGARPLVYIPVFPGTNCDYDTAKAFRAAGARVEFGVFRNLTPEDVSSSIRDMADAVSRCDILALSGGFSAGDEPDGSGKFIANVLGNSVIAAEVEKLIGRKGLILGICNGFQALVKSGLLPYGHTGCLREDSPVLFRNDINRHVSRIVTTRVESVDSPWLAGFTKGQTFNIPISHGEGKFTVDEESARELYARGQVAFSYVQNPNGSTLGIEGILSPDGLILGKMGHSERWEENLLKNIPGNRKQPLFENAVKYFSSKNE